MRVNLGHQYFIIHNGMTQRMDHKASRHQATPHTPHGVSAATFSCHSFACLSHIQTDAFKPCSTSCPSAHQNCAVVITLILPILHTTGVPNDIRHIARMGPTL